MEQTQGRVYRVAYRVLQSRADAEEATQEAFIRGWQQLNKFRFRSSVVTWLCRIAMNVSVDLLRHRKRQKLAQPQIDKELQSWIEQLPSDVLNPEEAMEWSRLQAQIEEILAAMKPDFRLAFSLREIDGLSYEEIAALTGAPVGTVESRIHRARKSFWKSYNKRR